MFGQEDPVHDLKIFMDSSISVSKRLDAIYRVRQTQYFENKEVIDHFIAQLEKDCEQYEGACCKIKGLKNRFIFMENRFVEYIPEAIELLNGNCDLEFRDSILIIWSLAKSIENGEVYLESIRYRQIIEGMLPRYLELFPDHLQYLTNMSNFYYAQGKFEEAVESYKQNLKYLEDNNQLFYIGTISNSIGACYNNLNKPDSAILYFENALKFYLKYNNFDSAYIHGLVGGNIAQSLMLKSRYHEAIPLLKNDIDGSRWIEPKNSIASMIELAECYVMTNRTMEARPYIDSIENYQEENKLSYRIKLNFMEVKAEVFDALNQSDLAIQTLNQVIEIIKKKDREVEINQSNVLVALYRVNEKQQIIDKQMIDNKNAQLELATKSKNQILIIGISVGILVVLIIVLVAHNKVTKKKQQLHVQNEINKASLEEKEVLLKEIHHRVKNNLQVVSGLLHLQSSKIDSPELLAVVEEGQQRIESMALIHQMLYQDDNDVSMIDCQEYLEQLIGQIEHSYGGRKEVEITINAEGMKLGFDYAIPLGLIINELTVNSFKYAFPNDTGKIYIDLSHCDKNFFKMIFKDNGVGIPDIDGLEKMNSLGLRLVGMLCEEMDANLDVSNSPGATFQVFFKECKNNERKS